MGSQVICNLHTRNVVSQLTGVVKCINSEHYSVSEGKAAIETILATIQHYTIPMFLNLKNIMLSNNQTLLHQ